MKGTGIVDIDGQTSLYPLSVKGGKKVILPDTHHLRNIFWDRLEMTAVKDQPGFRRTFLIVIKTSE